MGMGTRKWGEGGGKAGHCDTLITDHDGMRDGNSRRRR
jgi:hypothetical protein